MKKAFTILFILIGTVVGCGIGNICADIEPVKWLAIGGEVGFQNPVTLDLSFLQLTFGIWCRVNLAGILGLLLSAFFANKVFKWLKF